MSKTKKLSKSWEERWNNKNTKELWRKSYSRFDREINQLKKLIETEKENMTLKQRIAAELIEYNMNKLLKAYEDEIILNKDK